VTFGLTGVLNCDEASVALVVSVAADCADAREGSAVVVGGVSIFSSSFFTGTLSDLGYRTGSRLDRLASNHSLVAYGTMLRAPLVRG
jgi:hypothetical protein